MIDFLFAAGLCVAVDGDTLRCGDKRIRLHGIDAPDFSCNGRRDECWHNPKAAEAARKHLELLIVDRPVKCSTIGGDRYGRIVALCWASDSPVTGDLACLMVKAKHARDWEKYSKGIYARCAK